MARGEGIIQAGNKEIRIRFDNRALAEAEQQMKKSVIGALRGFDGGESGITELAHLLRAGMQAARRGNNDKGKPATLIEAYGVLDRAGFATVANEVLVAVAAVLSNDGKDEDEDDSPNE